MNTPKRILFITAFVLFAGAIPASMANPLTPSYYWDKWGEIKSPTDLALPNVAIGPLHPAFYSARIDDSQWLGTKATTAAMATETVMNPLHPHFYWR